MFDHLDQENTQKRANVQQMAFFFFFYLLYMIFFIKLKSINKKLIKKILVKFSMTHICASLTLTKSDFLLRSSNDVKACLKVT